MRVGVEVSPLIVLRNSNGTGALTHLRASAAYAGDHFELGLGLGAQLQHVGDTGSLSLAPQMRLGSLDGLHLILVGAYTISTRGARGTHFLLAGAQAEIDVPLSRRITLELTGGAGGSDGELGDHSWGSIGVRTWVRGSGGPGTLIVTGALGYVSLADRCLFGPGTPPECQDVKGSGPSVSVGLDARF